MINTECHSSSSNTNNSSGSNIENVSDPLTQLLSLPVSFSVDPLMTSSSVSTVTTVEATTMASSICSPNATNMSRKRSISPCQSTRMKKDTTNSVVTLKKSRVTLDDKDQKTKERILRNRAAAQESRDKKRRYIAELESNNQRLLHENDVMNKRLRMLEEQNALLQSQLDTFARQLTNIQAVQQLQQQQPAMNDTTTTTTTTTTSLNAHNSKFNAISPILFNDFCDSARIAKKEGLSNCRNLLLVVSTRR
ncbi:hypothetical protein BDF20DRAFT_435208 [Mycotypha africana]|uniref:uncharacterized protein n=1 Tax=Mycotypha africana TaxID=64632 RepID=UPI0023005F01|nr:uncharacterized protein BDF20DRAFT_435208 [Mycotypha africana]KAI8981896.1 hypothetical protein BDF20DRAFT_435208 [Mycotypha africana]